jgi:hypothetical protein
MRKFRLLLIASLLAGGASAQYFQHTYGSAQRREFLESGVNTNINVTPATQLGHIMTGYTDVTSRRSLMVTRTDLTGNILPLGFPRFNNRYQIFENSVAVDAKGRKVVHSGAYGGNISVWGDYGYTAGGVSTKFFYTMLTPGGVIIPAIWSYTVAAAVAEVEATSMVNSTSNPANMLVCGWVRYVAGGQRYPMAMSINGGNGMVNWSCVYNLNANGIDWIATDLIESPYPTQPPVQREMALSGHFTRPGFPSSGCFFRVDVMTGAFIPNLVEYGVLANPAQAELNSIDIANDPVNGAGFVLGGTFNNLFGGAFDAWALKVTPNGMGVFFSSLFDYLGTAPGNNNYGTDIMTRINTAGNHEYYLGGYSPFGIFGGEDDVVFKIDAIGVPVPLGQFTYGGQRDERVLQLDQYNNMAPANINGLSVFGNTSGSFGGVGLNDFYFVKAYFNGVQDPSCRFDIRDVPLRDGPGIMEWWNASCMNTLSRGNLTMTSAQMQDFQICLSSTAPGGDNSRLAPEQSITQPGYFPNPVSREDGLVTVTFGKEVAEGIATLELWNSLGQICWTKQVTVADGQTSMLVELGTQLQGGMYHLKVSHGGVLNNYRIVVQ